MGLPHQSKPGFATANGIVLRAGPAFTAKNYELFKEHEQEKKEAKGKESCVRSGRTVHSIILGKLRTSQSTQLTTEFEQVQMTARETNRGRLKVTSDMLRTVYPEVNVNVPFSSHPIIVKLQKLNDLNLGTHHHDINAAKRMALFISEKMHTTLIRQIPSGSSPLSLIVDTTTDYKGNHYLISFLRAIEQDMDVESQIVRERRYIFP